MVSASVVMPAYKRVDQTLITLELLLGSEGRGKEYELEIIVSDSTPDDSVKKAVAAKFGDSVRYNRPERPGIAANKNAGAKAATHPILIFSDSDMEPEKNTILHTLESLKKYPTTAMVGGNVIWKGGPNNGKLDRPRREDRMFTKNDTVYIEALYSRFIATYKDVFFSVGGYDEAVFNMRGEGSDLSIRYWRAGFPLSFDDSIKVHHVHDVPDAAAVRVTHSEWGIARDLLLLGYKYGMYEEDWLKFASTISDNFAPLGSEAPYRILQGIGKHLVQIAEAKPLLDAFRQNDKPAYPFKFLEIFSDTKLCDACLASSADRLSKYRTMFT